MPEIQNEDLVQRFKTIVQSAFEPVVRKYIEEALRCFSARAYNGAIVMIWNATIYYLHQVVETISFALFEHSYQILHGKRPPNELRHINDSLFVQTYQGIGLLQEEAADRVNKLRDCRNYCAHPTGRFFSADKVMELSEIAYEFISRRITEECLCNIAVIKEFIKTANKQEGETLAPWIQSDLCLQLAHELLKIFLQDDEEVSDLSGIMGLWHQIWERLDNAQKGTLWDRLEQKVVPAILSEGISPYTPEDLTRLIVWPSPDEEHETRDKIGKLYVEWFEIKVQEDNFRSVDIDLARNLRQHLSAPLRERLQSVLQEMIRRFAE